MKDAVSGMSKRSRVAAVLLITAILIFGLFQAAFAATDRYVAVTGTDVGNDCTNSASPCQTIQQAITVSGSDDVIHVGAGIYAERLVVDHPLTLSGAGSSPVGTVLDLSASSDSGHVIAIQITAGNVTLDGFRILTGESLNGIFADSTSVDSVITITNNYIEGWKTAVNPTRTCAAGDNFGLITNSDYAALVFQHNTLLGGCSNTILLEKHFGASDISYNTFDRGVDDVSTDALFVMNYDGPAVTTLQKVSHNTIDMSGGTVFTNNERGNAISFAASFTGAAGGFANIEVGDNLISGLQSYRRGVGLWNNSAAPGTTGGIQNARIERNTFVAAAPGGLNNGGVRFIGRSDDVVVRNNVVQNTAFGLLSMAWNSHITLAAEVTVQHNTFTLVSTGVDWQGTDTLAATCNHWGANSGPTNTANPGGAGAAYAGALTFSPWLIDAAAADASADPGLQLPAAFTVSAGGDLSRADNGYRRLANAVGCVIDDQTVTLSGMFDFGAPNALAAWEPATDALLGTNDDWEVDVPSNADGVTLTAASLGDATIQGPGDLPNVDLEGFLQFYNAGSNRNWTISNLRILDLDHSIGLYYYGGATSFDGLQIKDNTIRMATDLKGAAASGPENLQNIGIHLAYGKDIVVSGNTFEVPGDGVSDGATAGQDWWSYGVTPGWLYSTNVVLQSNTHGGAAYDGLLIENNTVNVLNAPNANPQRIIGFWENGHSHGSDITVRNNHFLNLSGGNLPANNRQMAFRPTSHSSAATTVLYEGNLSAGANIAFGPMTMAVGLQPVQMVSNVVSGCGTGYLPGANENWAISGGSLSGCAVGALVGGTAQLSLNDSTVINNGTGIRVTAGNSGNFDDNFFGGNSLFAVENTSGVLVSAINSWWGAPNGPSGAGPGAGDAVTTNVDFDPYRATTDPSELQLVLDSSCGSSVTLGPTTYPGGLVISCPVTVVGVPGTVVTNGSPAFTILADNVVIQDLIIDMDGDASNAIETGAAVDNLVLRNLEIREAGGNGIAIGHAVNNLQIVDNYIHDNTGAGVYYAGLVTGVHDVQGNLFMNNGAGVNNASTATYTVEYNAWGHYDTPSASEAVGLLDFTPWTHAAVSLVSSGSPVANKVTTGEQIVYAINLDARELYGADFDLLFDNTKLSVVSITSGGTLQPFGAACTISTPAQANASGIIQFCGQTFSVVDGQNLPLYTVTFQGVAPGLVTLDLDDSADTFAMSPPGGASTNIYAVQPLADGSVEVLSDFAITGRLDLQGRANDTGAQMIFQVGQFEGFGPYNASTTYWGALSFPSVAQDTYRVTASMPRYLDLVVGSLKDAVISADRALNTLVLLGGDANDDNVISLGDATLMGGQYNQTGSLSGDINNDNIVNLLDLAMMSSNFNLNSLTAYSSWIP